MRFYEEEAGIRNQVATGMKEEANDEVKLTIKFAGPIKYIKVILAVSLTAAYLYKPQYLTELLIIGVSLLLLLPQDFMDTYLEKPIDLRAAESDERQTLNATEANRHFSSAFDRIEKLEKSRKEDA